jgi:hypothetical protein
VQVTQIAQNSAIEASQNFPILHHNNSLFARSLELGMDTSYTRPLVYLQIVFGAARNNIVTGQHQRPHHPPFHVFSVDSGFNLSTQTHSCENKHL